MYLAYFDESGDSGQLPNSPSRFFVLACILIHEEAWLANLNKMIKLRRQIRDRYGVRVRAEIKAAHIKKGRGPLAGLAFAPERRARMFEFLIRYQNAQLDLTAFAIAIDKAKLAVTSPDRDPRDVAWQYGVQRVDSFCRHTHTRAILFPDRGHAYFIRRLVRQLRRHQIIPGHFGGSLKVNADCIVEDPNDRESHESYFIQLADWNAYAAHRSMHVDPSAPGYEGAWDTLGGSLLLDVNKLTGGPPGIVLYPR